MTEQQYQNLQKLATDRIVAKLVAAEDLAKTLKEVKASALAGLRLAQIACDNMGLKLSAYDAAETAFEVVILAVEKREAKAKLEQQISLAN